MLVSLSFTNLVVKVKRQETVMNYNNFLMDIQDKKM